MILASWCLTNVLYLKVLSSFLVYCPEFDPLNRPENVLGDIDGGAAVLMSGLDLERLVGCGKQFRSCKELIQIVRC